MPDSEGEIREDDVTTRLLLLDRDGTLNRTDQGHPPDTPDRVQLFPDVRPTLSRYVAEGWQLVIVTNQGGVASGYLSEEQAQAVQQRVVDLLQLPVAAAYLCPHMPDAVVPQYALDCPNRKPQPGFLLTALERFGAQAQDCLFVGDSITDQQAARAAQVPFSWADRFFGRPISRGLHTTDERWIRIREAMRQDDAGILALLDRQVNTYGSTLEAEVRQRVEQWHSAQNDLPAAGAGSTPEREQPGTQRDLVLLAVQNSTMTGCLLLLWERFPGARSAELLLVVDSERQNQGIDALLMETGMEWAGQQKNLERVCVQVSAAEIPFSRLCCKLGFVQDTPKSRPKGRALPVEGSITMTCYR
jgi:D-glycero-D-manno-heptose 1,7-bisphosphate phosphatase